MLLFGAAAGACKDSAKLSPTHLGHDSAFTNVNAQANTIEAFLIAHS